MAPSLNVTNPTSTNDETKSDNSTAKAETKIGYDDFGERYARLINYQSVMRLMRPQGQQKHIGKVVIRV